MVTCGAIVYSEHDAMEIAKAVDGEVDYIVATDAIGMGLNLDIDHVAFASDMKFDGNSSRKLLATEISQIAGRAGRSTKNGTFGVISNELKFDRVNSSI